MPAPHAYARKHGAFVHASTARAVPCASTRILEHASPVLRSGLGKIGQVGDPGGHDARSPPGIVRPGSGAARGRKERGAPGAVSAVAQQKTKWCIKKKNGSCATIDLQSYI